LEGSSSYGAEADDSITVPRRVRDALARAYRNVFRGRHRRRLVCGRNKLLEASDDLPPSDTYTPHLQASDISLEVMLSSGQKRVCKQGTKCESKNSAILLHHRQQVGSPTAGGFSFADKASVLSHYLPNYAETVARFSNRLFGGVFSQNGSVFMSSCQDQHIRLYNTEKSKFCCFKNIKAKEVGWTIVDVSYSPDQNYLIYSSWCDSIYLCSVHKDSDTHIPLHLRPDSMYRFCPFSIRFSQDNREILAGFEIAYVL
jgi:WD repeat-containing protein 23